MFIIGHAKVYDYSFGPYLFNEGVDYALLLAIAFVNQLPVLCCYRSQYNMMYMHNYYNLNIGTEDKTTETGEEPLKPAVDIEESSKNDNEEEEETAVSQSAESSEDSSSASDSDGR